MKTEHAADNKAQEWTAEDIKELLAITGHQAPPITVEAIRKAINASITAERERCDEIWRIGKAELAAEREKAQALRTVHEVFCVGIRKALKITCPVPISDILDVATAMTSQVKQLREAQQPLVDALTFYMKICGNTAYQLGRDTAREMYDCGKSALAKVKEGR